MNTKHELETLDHAIEQVLQRYRIDTSDCECWCPKECVERDEAWVGCPRHGIMCAIGPDAPKASTSRPRTWLNRFCSCVKDDNVNEFGQGLRYFDDPDCRAVCSRRQECEHADFLEAMLEEAYRADSGKTNEINILTKENRDQGQGIAKALDLARKLAANDHRARHDQTPYETCEAGYCGRVRALERKKK